MASAREVLPDPGGPTKTTFRMHSGANAFIRHPLRQRRHARVPVAGLVRFGSPTVVRPPRGCHRGPAGSVFGHVRGDAAPHQVHAGARRRPGPVGGPGPAPLPRPPGERARGSKHRPGWNPLPRPVLRALQFPDHDHRAAGVGRGGTHRPKGLRGTASPPVATGHPGGLGRADRLLGGLRPSRADRPVDGSDLLGPDLQRQLARDRRRHLLLRALPDPVSAQAHLVVFHRGTVLRVRPAVSHRRPGAPATQRTTAAGRRGARRGGLGLVDGGAPRAGD